ncbi:hypothetical protein BH09SUM1_BH09SUM1_17400 [soil metagenome]
MRLFGNKLIIAAFLSLASAGFAQTWSVMLPPESANELPADARSLYDQAVIENDHINYDETVKLLAAAAEKAPKHGELQFLTATRARNRAEVYYSAASFTDQKSLYIPPQYPMDYISPPWRVSEPYYEIADQALQRLIANTSLSDEQRTRLSEESRLMEARRSTLAKRDADRIKTALPLTKQIQDDRRALDRESRGEKEDPLDPYYSYADIKKQTELAIAAPTETISEEEMNPFLQLPGEWLNAFMPPAPQPNQPGAAGGQPSAVDEFGNPIQQGAPPPPAGDFIPITGEQPTAPAPPTVPPGQLF